MSTPPTVVVVHGACHGNPSYMAFLAQWLDYYGIPSVVTSQPSDNSNPPTKGMYDDAKHIREVITKEVDAGKDVVVFMHSYGGVVGTEASQGLVKAEREKKGLKGGVVHLYYCCAFMIQEGKSLVSVVEDNPNLTSKIAIIEPNGLAYFPTPEKDLYNDLLPDAASYWATQIHTFTLQDSLDPLTHATWKDVPSTYLLCTKDQAIQYELQKWMLEQVNAAGINPTTETLEVAHSPFLNMPAKVAESVARACGVTK